MRYKRDAPVVAALCPILLFVEYNDDGIFLLLRHLAPPPNNTNDDIEQSPAQGGMRMNHDTTLLRDEIFFERFPRRSKFLVSGGFDIRLFWKSSAAAPDMGSAKHNVA